jgi:chromosome segregation protein
LKFKKLEVAGFKSFADRLEVKFGAGITAIVGPNGCGKSNVADSIRWVLGEQSAKLLRGSSMVDVIFNGTEHRKSLSFCEVNLYFDNSEKLFPTLDFNEVVISRKLYRSGESEYLLNKSACRLKDIIDILRDAGMGREGYSIIGQGRIDELLSSKPENRREIFEEAAGISKFKARKTDAERKLTRTNENLLRVNDILDEKAKQLDPLTRQSENARKWLELRDKLKHYEINTYIYQYDTANEAKSVINTRLNGILDELNLRQGECDRVSADYNAAMEAVNSADKSIEDLREELLELTVGIEKQAGEIKLLNERSGYLSAQNEKLADENERLADRYARTTDLIERGAAALEDKKRELALLRGAAERHSNDYLKVIETMTEGEGEVQTHHRAIVAAMDKLAEIKANMSRLVAEREGLVSGIDDLKNRIAYSNDKLNADLETEKTLGEQIAELKNNRAALTAEIDALYAVGNECLSQINECASGLDKLNADFYSLKTRRKMLDEMRRSFEGFAYGVKKLLADAKTDKDIAKRAEGVVASLITVDPKFETAIELALGGAVQNIVTQNEDDAKFLIEYLKRGRYGRVTFLPITSVKERRVPDAFAPLLKGPGCFGAASDLVGCDQKFRGVIKGLLGATVVVDNMDTAVAMAKRTDYAFKIVTLDGDIINPSGSMTGGSKKSELSNIFGYDREITELDAQIASIESRVAELTKKRSDAADRRAQNEKSVRELSDAAHDIDVALSAREETFAKLTAAIEELTVNIGNLEFEVMEDDERVAVIDRDLGSVAELESLITGEKELAAAGGEERLAKFEELRGERDRLHELMLSARAEVSTAENIVFNAENDIKRLQEDVRATAGQIEINNAQTAENRLIIANIDAEISAFSTVSGADDSDRVREIRNSLANLDGFKHKNQAAVAELDARRMSLIDEIRSLSDKRSKEEMMLLKVDSDIEIMQQRVTEEYNLTYADCLPFKAENYDLAFGISEAARIKRQMAALGNINLDAIEQCKIMYESYNELNGQREDLTKAAADLTRIIAELSAEMLSRFSERFEQIRANFRKIFKELFDGGSADLILLESENPLEAGIEIFAQPPEKKLQSISLLSGGERALTAIAILFAILRLKPMPFCVLDEIEAALDDPNAGRFAKYLRRFSEDTQFIVITHRKPTMELADSLYGVTMEEKGVSKIVSVKLSDAVAVAEPHLS